MTRLSRILYIWNQTQSNFSRNFFIGDFKPLPSVLQQLASLSNALHEYQHTLPQTEHYVELHKQMRSSLQR